jgi:hypothetical protein
MAKYRSRSTGSAKETLIKALARICNVILSKLCVKNARNTSGIAVLFALILGKIPIADTYHFFNQRFPNINHESKEL